MQEFSVHQKVREKNPFWERALLPGKFLFFPPYSGRAFKRVLLTREFYLFKKSGI